MSIFNLFKEQLSSVIQWKNPETNTIWHQFPSGRDEIINASKLIIAPGQGCVLVYEGEIANVLTESGSFNLKTDNHPFITTLLNLRQNFESQHKLQIFFFKTTQIVGQMWGTPSPIKWIDPEYQIPVEAAFNGNFSYQIQNPNLFFTQFIGTKSHLQTDDLKRIIVERLLGNFASFIHQNKYTIVEIDSQLKALSQGLKEDLNPIFAEMGFVLTDFRIVGNKFDDATTARIGRIADITSDNRAATQAGLSFVELERVRAMRDAAKNEGGLAGAGMQFGMGAELARQFHFDSKNTSAENDSTIEKLKKLKILLDENIITEAEFQQKKEEFLNHL